MIKVLLDNIKVTTKDLSQRQLDILLKVEDPDFYNHHGVDFKTPGAGWTTITQGLAKQFYFKNFKQGIMKIKQTLCARFALDPLVSKKNRIDLYLNIMYYGNGVYGLKDAAN
jgi:membrane carboxypeptidase/penicillin-binding protein